MPRVPPGAPGAPGAQGAPATTKLSLVKEPLASRAKTSTVKGPGAVDHGVAEAVNDSSLQTGKWTIFRYIINSAIFFVDVGPPHR